MGKKRIVKKGEEGAEGAAKVRPASSSTKKRFDFAHLIRAINLQQYQGCFDRSKRKYSCLVFIWKSLGFKGAKKGTPFAAAKVGELLGTKAADHGR
jgi:hypothetical protein